jgi:transcriptional regulator GlxA family with amidase domain
VTPTFWETGWAMFLFILLGGTVVSAITYTFLYIRRIKQQQKETLNAYLHVLNSKVDVDEKMAENKEKLKLARLKAEDDAFMQRVMKFVELHLGDSDINMDDMAEATATSRSGLSRRMKAILGVTPAEFIKDARIQKACNMLVESTVSVTEIAFCCGFSNPKYFSRCFKSATNLSPSEYRAAKMNEEI